MSCLCHYRIWQSVCWLSSDQSGDSEMRRLKAGKVPVGLEKSLIVSLVPAKCLWLKQGGRGHAQIRADTKWGESDANLDKWSQDPKRALAGWGDGSDPKRAWMIRDSTVQLSSTDMTSQWQVRKSLERWKGKVSVSHQSCPTLCSPVDCSLPDFSVHGILQGRILEWEYIPFSRGSSQPKSQTWVSCIAGRFFTVWATREAQEITLLTFIDHSSVEVSGVVLGCVHALKRGGHPPVVLRPSLGEGFKLTCWNSAEIPLYNVSGDHLTFEAYWVPILLCRNTHFSSTCLSFHHISQTFCQVLRDILYPTQGVDRGLLLFSSSIMSNSLRLHGVQHTRLLTPWPSPRVCSNWCPLSRWCHLAILSSVTPFSSCPQSFPTSGSFTMSWLFASGGQSYWSFSFSVSPSKEYSGLISFRIDWFDLLAVQGTLKGLIQHYNLKASIIQDPIRISEGSQPSLWSNSHNHTWLLEKP